MNTLSVIMVSYQTGPALWLAIESAMDQPECSELILVDNGNIPGTLHRLKALAEKEPRFKLITGHGNVGFARACNMGVRASRSDIVLLLNPDCMLASDALARALEILSRYPQNSLAGCHLLNPDGSEQRGSRRSLMTLKNAVAEAFHLSRFTGQKDPLNFHGTSMPEHAHEVPAISGAFMMLSRAFYDQLGGLDEGYFLHMEDMDLCWRVHQAGGKVIFMPEVRVIHFRSTSEVASAKVEYHKAKGFIRYLEKHFAAQHPKWLLMLASAGIWARYGIKTFINAVDRVFEPPLVAKREVARLVVLYRLAYFGPRNDSLKGKTILVTGASGQVGLCVVGKALARGAKVIGIYNRTRIPFAHANLVWEKRDITKDKLDFEADTLINTTALWQLPDMLEGVLDKGIKRVIAFGSTSVFGKASSKNAYEQDIVNKLALAEERVMGIAKVKNAHATILRPTMIYGIGLDANITRLADVVRRFGVLAVFGEASGKRHPVQAVSLATAALDIIDNTVTFGKAYNLGGGQEMTYYGMLNLIFEYLGKKPRFVKLNMLPKLLDWLGKIYQVSGVNGEMARRMNQDLVFDIGEAQHDFGYHPRGFLQGNVTL